MASPWSCRYAAHAREERCARDLIRAFSLALSFSPRAKSRTIKDERSARRGREVGDRKFSPPREMMRAWSSTSRRHRFFSPALPTLHTDAPPGRPPKIYYIPRLFPGFSHIYTLPKETKISSRVSLLRDFNGDRYEKPSNRITRQISGLLAARGARWTLGLLWEILAARRLCLWLAAVRY